MLYIFVFLHQTATNYSIMSKEESCISLFSYIKPQHDVHVCEKPLRCISLFSYIKPQQSWKDCFIYWVVYLCFPTSNRNVYVHIPIVDKVVYLCFPTSNRNNRLFLQMIMKVVYLCFPTSNRNLLLLLLAVLSLYIFVFLHQTATRE